MEKIVSATFILRNPEDFAGMNAIFGIHGVMMFACAPRRPLHRRGRSFGVD